MKRALYLSLLLVSILFVAACEDVKAVLPDNGELLIQINGLPNDAKAGILVNGPDDYEKEVDVETTLTDLDAGSYKITATPVVFGGETYTPDKETDRVDVERNERTDFILNYTK